MSYTTRSEFCLRTREAVEAGGCIRSEDGSMLTGCKEKCSRWERYIKKFL